MFPPKWASVAGVTQLMVMLLLIPQDHRLPCSFYRPSRLTSANKVQIVCGVIWKNKECGLSFQILTPNNTDFRSESNIRLGFSKEVEGRGQLLFSCTMCSNLAHR